VAEEHTHGAWLVEFSPLSDPQLLPKAIAAAFELGGRADRPLVCVLTHGSSKQLTRSGIVVL
jgi:hypothetical protein